MTEFPEFTPEQQARIAAAPHLCSLPYDGVVGTPPEWFPPKDRNEFLTIRSRLLLEFSARSVLLMIQYLGGSLPEELEREGFYVSIPRLRMPDIGRLLQYKRAFDRGPVEGLDLLLGKNIAGNERTGRRVLQGARSGHEAVHGTEQEKHERWGGYQKKIDKLRNSYPNYSHHKLCEIASAEFGIPSRTLRLRTK